mgnify:CR=1 FL=1
MGEHPPLDEERRLAYLEAMGVSVWALRSPWGAMSDSRAAESGDSVPSATALPLLDASGTQPRVVAESTPRASAPVEPAPMTVETAARPAPTSAAREAPSTLADAPSAEPESWPFPDWDETPEYSPSLMDEWDAMGHPPASEAEAVNPIERMDWDALDAAVRGCRACRLWETRTKTVFGVGDRRADLMIIGEAPGADEDRQGEPFVGRAGQLLTRMLAAIGFSREQVYIANVLKCRPPGNRDPKPDESLACQAYLQRQVALIEPKVILSVGRISAQQLLKTDTPVGRLRGQWFDYGPARIPLRVTYHPAYLLRSPEQKAKAWDDLTEVWRRL